MKNIFIYLLTALLSLTAGQGIAQIVIDLRSGITNANFWYMLPNATDDTWEILQPGAPGYVAIKCGSGYRASGGLYFNNSSYVRWLSPNLDPTSGNHYPTAAAGTYTYRAKFVLASCPVTGYTFSINHLLVDDQDVVTKISVNGNLLNTPNVSYGCCINMIGAGSAFVQGVNYVTVEVFKAQPGPGYTGIQIEATLKLKSCAYVDLNLKDQAGNVKSEFCIDEGIFLNPTGIVPSAYKMDLWYKSGTSSYSQIGFSTAYISGSSSGINISSFFANQNIAFQTTGSYKVIVTYTGVCGPLSAEATFNLICCNNSPNASFNMSINTDGHLTGNTALNGHHKWEIYSFSQYNGQIEPATPVAIINDDHPGFSINAQSPCYYVRHTLNNGCGISCTSKRFCKFGCEEKVCNLSNPELTYDANTKMLNWPAVSGAAGYIIQTIKDGCCSSIISMGNLTNTTVPDNNPYLFDPYNGGETLGGDCYSVVVFAKCPDGSLSQASNLICIFP